MGQNTTQQRIQEDYQIKEVREDGSALLKHKKTEEEFQLRSHCSNIEDEMVGFQDLLQKRQEIKSAHLLELIQITSKSEKQICSVLHKLYLLIQFPFKTLQDEINERKRKIPNNYFVEDQLWSILYSSSSGLHTLYLNKFNHESLNPKQIYINKDGLIKISDPILLGLEKNYITVLKKRNDEGTYLSPEIMNFLDDCNFSFYDKETSDVFVLGLIMLEASLLKKIELYDTEKKRPKLESLPSFLHEVRERYSESYAEILRRMLQLHSRHRPKLGEIVLKIQQENNMLDDTDETQNKNFSQFPSKSLQSNEQVTYQPQTFLPEEKKANHVTFSFKQNKKTPITKMNNPQVFSAYIPSFQNKFPQYSPIRKENDYYKSAITPSSHIFPQEKYIPKPVPESERFSYKNFGNIQMKNSTKPKQQILFSYDIPEIRDILIKQKPSPLEQKTIYEPPKIQAYKPNVTINPPRDDSPLLKQSIKSSQISPWKYSNIMPQIPQEPINVKSSVSSNSSRKECQYSVSQKLSSILMPSSSKPGTPRNSFPSRSFSKHDIFHEKNLSGEIINEMEGYVSQILEGGGRYEGKKVNGVKNGYGKLYFRDGGHYEGDWKDNKMHGFGKLYYQNGQIAYEGYWVEDEFNGEGRVFNDRPEKILGEFNYYDFADLNDKWVFYEGEFKNDSKHGKGKIKLTNGQVFEGNFIYDSIEGEGIFYSVKGEAIEGYWKDSLLIDH